MSKPGTGFVVGLYLCLSIGQVLAQSDPAPIQTSDQLTLSQLLDEVLETYPVSEELPARLEEAAKFDKKARSLLADAVSLEMRVQSGRIGNNDNLREYEAGIELPLWRLGERKASKVLARGIKEEASTFASFIRWQLSGVVRAALWNIRLTADQLAKTEKAVPVSADLLRGIERQVELGELPRSDLLQAKQDKLNSEIRLNAAQVEYANAVRTYRVITRRNTLPASLVEVKSARTGVVEEHPALAHSAARLARATAEYRLQQESANASPALLLGTRSERGGMDSSFEDSVGLSFRYPMGFGSQVNAGLAAPAVEAAAARAEHRSQRRQLEIAAHNAEQNLAGAEREYRLSQQKSELAQQHLAMSGKAFELGEMNLMIFLIVKETAYEAEMGASQKNIQWHSAVADYNQAVGELP